MAPIMSSATNTATIQRLSQTIGRESLMVRLSNIGALSLRDAKPSVCSNDLYNLFQCVLRLRQRYQHPVVKHFLILVVIQLHTLCFRAVPELSTIRKQDVARADKQRYRRKILETSVNRTHEIM